MSKQIQKSATVGMFQQDAALEEALQLMLDYSEKTFDELKLQCQRRESGHSERGILAGRPSPIYLQPNNKQMFA
ncbi:hypothetical protein K6U58_17975 [Vibrio fluvialis]|uniref:hypothetical protein n=1 Tax=Vibrio fluvialis TaxID=676 RepID=UPI001EEB21E3|nr:hypothetical protein [Vibrio fluvialis]MCG6360453.1 hypothetical protein [Vibrio fluvialis]